MGGIKFGSAFGSIFVGIEGCLTFEEQEPIYVMQRNYHLTINP